MADQTPRMELQTLKGWGFVLATGLRLYWMIRRDVQRLERSTAACVSGASGRCTCW